MMNDRSRLTSEPPRPAKAKAAHPLAWVVGRPHHPSLVLVVGAIVAFALVLGAIFGAFTALGFGMDAMRLRAADSYGSVR